MQLQSLHLNREQQEFFDYVLDVVKNRKTGIITLNAAGGTGKTFTLQRIQKQILLQGLNINMVAPTNKAASLLKNGKTIHKFLNIQQTITSDGVQEFKLHHFKCPHCLVEFKESFETELHIHECEPIGETNKEVSYDITIVDEASMLDNQMLISLSNMSKYSLIIFAGDNNQIPPINIHDSYKTKYGDISPAFQYVFTLQNFTLTEIMRFKDDDIRRFNDAFRKCIQQFERIYIKKTDIGVMLQTFKDSKDSVVVSYTNKEKDKYNKIIREYLFADELTKEELYTGEQLIFSGYMGKTRHNIFLGTIKGEEEVSESNPAWKNDLIQQASNFDEYVTDLILKMGVSPIPVDYHTSDTIEVGRLTKHAMTISYYACEHIQSKTTKKLPACAMCGVQSRPQRTYSIQYYEFTDQVNTTFRWVIEPHREIVKDIFKHYKKHILSIPPTDRNWSGFYFLKNNLLPTLEYSYSLTTHKAQGSQYQNVFVNINNIRAQYFVNMNGQNYMSRLAYTAVSRATSNLYFI